MTAYAWEEREPHAGLLRLRVALRAFRLDAQLAAGADPVGCRELALRAGQLVNPRRRARFARSLRRAIESAELTRGVPARGAAVPVNRGAILEAGPTLAALANDLLELVHPNPRGVALVVQLLRDGAGPLYRPWTPGDLREAAERARAAL